MSIEELLELARENHWSIEFTLDGELVFFTGVIDETKVKEIPEEEEPWEHDTGDFDEEYDEEDGPYDGLDVGHDEFLE